MTTQKVATQKIAPQKMMLQKLSPLAAFLNPLVAVLTLLVAFVLIGPAVMADRALFANLALTNPTPLLLQDGLKLLSAAIALVLIWALHRRLSIGAPKRMAWATGFGVLSVLVLLANAILSLYATTQAATFAGEQAAVGMQLNAIIGGLAMLTIFLNGCWYLLTGWSALATGGLPRPLAYLTLLMGLLSLVPILGLLVLLLSIAWSIWLGVVLLRTRA